MWQPRTAQIAQTPEDYAELLIALTQYEKQISGRLLRKEYTEAKRAAYEMRDVLADLIRIIDQMEANK